MLYGWVLNKTSKRTLHGRFLFLAGPLTQVGLSDFKHEEQGHCQTD